ncbi:hypothetical protein J41TS12_05820 [Paenibacillus antibioticophila]|uniref:Uncharacterized protein n=1 Tax=Paenibacillus antibioticophila TaxID=1274374 RepID=A0A919XMG5_9BACL|nr:hypothetical protein [Paenibacillus antibioticophila]GIO35721.1 hypothetical protein J41TS12_05820 [Paenibacillus antibioticophila]
MPSRSELSLYNKYPWAIPVVPDVPEPFFAQPKPWDFSEPVLKLIEEMFEEIEEFFKLKNLPVEVTIYEIRNVFGYLHVEALSSQREVYSFLEKYKKLSKDLN